jgi:hypothetical protein
MEPDFSGWATKAGLKCTDGRTIGTNAFSHMNGKKVPLVWQHGHDSPENILGHALLTSKAEGLRCDAFFNETKQGKNAKALVEHQDINALSIYANQLVEKAKQVLHGMVREVSLVLSGANPGALIDYVRVQHSDSDEPVTLEDEAVIYTGLTLQHGAGPAADDSDETEEVLEHADPTVQDVYDSLSDQQKEVVNFMIGAALQQVTGNGPAAHSDIKTDDNKPGEDAGDEGKKEGTDMVHKNIFEKGETPPALERHVLSHSDMQGLMASAIKGGSLKAAVEEYAVAHGITNLDVLFPDAKTLGGTPEFKSRRMAWVPGVLNGTHHSPFSRVKTITADITQDSARALGYIKGSYKKEEWFSVTARTTTPTTVYKKQKLDRDDIVDIVDFDVVAWMRAEMRVMLDEELARAILIGDGRAVDDEDKIKDPMAATDGAGIRSIYNEHEAFAVTVNVNIDDASSSYTEVIESVLRARTFYKGSGSPSFYTTNQVIVEMLLLKDTLGRRLYNSIADLAAALMVSEIVEVEVMNTVDDLVGIIVNLSDYNIGADKGGEVNLFDDFDIDYNQYKYLIETRVSGALTRMFSALVIKKTTSTNVLVAPTDPTFVKSTGVVTIPTKTGVVYKNGDTNATLSAGAQTALAVGATLNVLAVPASGYYFATNAEDEWSFTRPAA